MSPLDRLAVLLRRGPLTARQIADRLGCSKPTAYTWIQALVERGDSVYSIAAKGDRPGPRAKAYGVR